MPLLDPGEREERQTPVSENLRVQQAHWRFEQIGFYVLLLVMLLALLGLFSKGGLSLTHAQTVSGSLAVEYQRFLRNGATSNIVLTVRGKPGQVSRIQISGALLDGVTVESIVPPPRAAATFAGGGLELTVRPDATGQARIHLALRSDGVGSYRSQLQANGETVKLYQFIYP